MEYEDFLYHLEADPAGRLKARMKEAGEAKPVILPFGERPDRQCNRTDRIARTNGPGFVMGYRSFHFYNF